MDLVEPKPLPLTRPRPLPLTHTHTPTPTSKVDLVADFRGSKAADTSAKLGQGQGTGQAEGGTGSQHGGGMQQGGGPTGRVVMPEGVQLMGGEALLEEQAAGRLNPHHPHL